MATPRVAAGVLFFDGQGRIFVVKPSYKEGWDIPGGYVEPNESPREACSREIEEELGISPSIGSHLVVDWAPAESEGDKILFVFDGGILGTGEQSTIRFPDGELLEWKFIYPEETDIFMPARLARRIKLAVEARHTGNAIYAEHGKVSS